MTHALLLTIKLLLYSQSITTYASNTGNGTAVYYPHYEFDLLYTGLTPDIVNNTGTDQASCGACYNGYLVTCVSSPSKTLCIFTAVDQIMLTELLSVPLMW